MLQKLYERENYELLILYHIGFLENSIHFIFAKHSKQCIIIDPAWEADLFLTIIHKKGYKLSQIWLTHWHPDHVNATDELITKTKEKIKVFIGKNELDFLQIKANLNLLQNGDSFKFDKIKVQVIETPGHTKGGICYILSDDIFVGDTLFIYGAGHCALPGANPQDFFYSMQKIKNNIPDHLYVRCGHDYGEKLTTTIKEQKLGNPFLLIENVNDFIEYREQIHDKTRTYPMEKMTKQQVLTLLC